MQCCDLLCNSFLSPRISLYCGLSMLCLSISEQPENTAQDLNSALTKSRNAETVLRLVSLVSPSILAILFVPVHITHQFQLKHHLIDI